jgi:hypothetical protein
MPNVAAYVDARAANLRNLRTMDSFSDVALFVAFDMGISFTRNSRAIIQALANIGVK